LAVTALPIHSLAATAPPAFQVSVEGQVARPGVQSVPADTRLASVLDQATPLPSAYVLGAAWLRDGARAGQARLKAGLQFDLQQWEAGPDTTLAQASRTLLAQLNTLPVTGRVVPQSLEGRWLEVRSAENRPVAAGDRIVLPTRPTEVHVVGAVQQPCTLMHAAMRVATEYLADCPRLAAADKDILYVIQPDGRVFEHGIALWNRHDGQTLAPGATLYVPLDSRAIRALDPQFNQEYARFLATQVMGQEASP
jgi:protein involved in polysaccharide export with SLBB domain